MTTQCSATRESTESSQALYVDDGLVSTTSDKEYALFIKALKQRFELSADDSEVTWYLGVSVKRDMAKGTLQLTQEQYITDMLSRFKMEDVNPAITPMEIGTRLTSEDCPDIKDINKEVLPGRKICSNSKSKRKN